MPEQNTPTIENFPNVREGDKVDFNNQTFQYSPLGTFIPSDAQPGSPSPNRSILNPDGTVNRDLARKQLAEIEKQARSISSKVNERIKRDATPEGSIAGSSDSVIQDEKDLGQRIESSIPGGDINAVMAASNAYTEFLDKRMADLEARQERDLAEVNRQSDSVIKGTKEEQEREKGTTRVTLARIGGFLGASASSTGAMINLAKSHRNEIQSLEAKRQAALQAARDGFADQSFELAALQLKEAKELQQTINKRKQDFFDNNLKLAQEQRRDNEFYRSEIESDLAAFQAVALSGDNVELDEARVQEINDFYGSPNFVEDYIDIVRQENKAKSLEEQRDFDMKLISTLKGIPENRSVMIGGVTYNGLKETHTDSYKMGDTIISPETANIIDGIDLLDNLTPTARAKAITELSELGFYSSVVPDWFRERFEKLNPPEDEEEQKFPTFHSEFVDSITPTIEDTWESERNAVITTKGDEVLFVRERLLNSLENSKKKTLKKNKQEEINNLIFDTRYLDDKDILKIWKEIIGE